MDKCVLTKHSKKNAYETIMNRGLIKVYSQEKETESITSEPFQLCFCDNHDVHGECNRTKKIRILRGQLLQVPLFAIGQGKSVLPTKVTTLSSGIRFNISHTSKILPRNCLDLILTLYSQYDYGEIELYPDGPCHHTGIAKAVIDVIFLPCPDGFSQLGEECVCEERLQRYGAQCIIREENLIYRKSTSPFWMKTLERTNGTYLGLILHHFCPVDYCAEGTIPITLDNLDIQCAPNRTGVLCGKCINNYSLLLGSSQCGSCSNRYLALLLPFAVAGVALIFFLSIFRLTVATGMINSAILYANIIQVNRKVFFSSDGVNVLTLFIAWLNLDIGIETCFYDGLDAYIQTWLQFAFPAYIWILISMIIITSRYSITISKLIGSNPIAVLATLILMSYTKTLRVIIDVFSFVYLDYPNGKKVSVWLKDGNVEYFELKHCLLVVATSLVTVIFFLPYTLLLLLGPFLYRIQHRKCIHWLNKIKPLLDSYYAPYKKNARYWTGFLLVVRCGLYTVFSYFSIEDVSNNLVTMIVIFSGILFLIWITGKIYDKFYLNIMEGMIYLNLIVLSVITLANVKHKKVMVYILVGIMFITMTGVVFYQFYFLYIKRRTKWIKKKISRLYQTKIIAHRNSVRETSLVNNTSQVKSPMSITRTFIELREPLLENN